ncbi:response regulator transcription factor [candidate division KSB1 bacterium]|nr:response regulator transcription factor [candidate division KSB1 bacterium]NIR72597.1 response regulator transcription factor [candidate division KSB1 bacterium]NIS23657.1 response regulator transcription factor [candidate division KSB1 bacterium]NIT70581.1 response regulator transcription factor [candidate division KSB1 bacterium]NIU24299.1 response regulator transcription factor [candidate division KSB1 bacterium]
MLRTVIIDDEEKSRKLLRNLLNSYCTDVEVLALADSVPAGVQAIRRFKPDLVFLDIVMPNEDGFELLDQIEDITCEIIFTTAYDRYAIRAIRACALDYLLKPIDVEELQAAVDRARTKALEATDHETVDHRLNMFIENSRLTDKQSQKIGLPTLNGIKFYPINKIFCCKAEGNYTTIHFEGREKLELVSKTLKDFEELLVEYNFIRTHRSYLINLNHLKEYRRINTSTAADGEGGCVVMGNNMKVPVSRDKRKVLLQRISRPF